MSRSDADCMTLSYVHCHKLVQRVLKSYVYRPIFSQVSFHMFDNEGFNNHLVFLLKAVTEKYLHVRYYYAGKKYTAHIQNKVKVNQSRQVMNKLVLFTGQ